MSSMVTNKFLAAALEYAEIGFRVIPLHTPNPTKPPTCSCGKLDCGSVGKHPRTLNGLKDATADRETIVAMWQRWPTANVGIVTGSESSIIVIDLDDGSGPALAELTDANGQLPETVEADTGGGGMHLLFQHPGQSVRNSAGKLGERIDVRGDGGYIVAPPSVHESGRAYQWRIGQSPMERKVAAMPDWLLGKLLVPAREQTSTGTATEPTKIAARLLGKAIGDSREGNRNDVGFWLACQLRDNNVSRIDAESFLKRYAVAVPGTGYSEREAMASVASAYNGSKREPLQDVVRAVKTQQIASDKPRKGSDILAEYLRGVSDGKIRNVPFPFRALTKLTQGLLPGSVFTICGSPGVGKTFFDLQCLLFWQQNGVKASALFLEKNQRFYLQRLLAMLEGKGAYVDYDWLGNPDHREKLEIALDRWKEVVDEIHECIDTANVAKPTLADVSDWINRKFEQGNRVVIIDPITMATAAKERWVSDEQFLFDSQRSALNHGASIILITHPKKGGKPGQPTADDVANGAAYNRNTDTLIWLLKHKKPKLYRLAFYREDGPSRHQTRCPIVAQMHKTRDGRGAGMEIGFTFGEGLQYVEQGLVTEELKEHEDGVSV